MTKYKLAQEQDKLEKYLLKTDTGMYVNMFDQQAYINDMWQGFSIKQNELERNLLRLNGPGKLYLPVTTINEVRTRPSQSVSGLIKKCAQLTQAIDTAEISGLVGLVAKQVLTPAVVSLLDGASSLDNS